MKIYTKTGDKGATSLVSGRRVSKDEAIIEAYGSVDELNSFTGLLDSTEPDQLIRQDLRYIQNVLFNIGSILAQDEADFPDYPTLLPEDTQFLERRMDEMDKNLPRMNAFILPAGSQQIALAHVCRTICRRAERRVISIDRDDKFSNVVIYLNRLSDYYFVLARHFHHSEEVPEVKWDAKFREKE